MKYKYKVIILLLIFILLLCTGCSEEEPIITGPRSYTIKEYDATSNIFTQNTLIELTIPEQYTIAKKEELSIEGNSAYVGIFTSEKDNITFKVVQQYNYEPDKNNFVKVSDTVSVHKNNIDKNKLENKFKFYIFDDSKDFVTMLIVENKKNKLNLEYSLMILQDFITTEEFFMPEKEKDLTVEASLETPAKLDEWATVYIKNNVSNSTEPIIIKIDNIYTKSASMDILTDYANVNGLGNKAFVNGKDICYYVFDYSVFVSDFFTIGENGLNDIKIPFRILSDTGDESINGYAKGLNKVYDITDTTQEIKPNSIWTGRAYFKMSSGFKRFVLKVQESGEDAVYFNFYN